jgi:RecJ-like exonuclease
MFRRSRERDALDGQMDMKDESQPTIVIKEVEPELYAQKCPVCNGFGTLKYGAKTCQACTGKGYVLVPVRKDGWRDEPGR